MKPHEASCATPHKRVFDTKRDARITLDRFNGSTREYGRAKMTIYWCRFCAGFHVGHPRQPKRPKKRPLL